MKVNAGQASSTLIPEYIGSDFDKVTLVSENLDYIKSVAEGIAGMPVKSYIGDTPPKNPVNGSEWYCTTDGRTYVWYEDGNSSQWVESSPQSTNNGLEKNLDAILDPKYKQIREALRRSYAEAGYNLVTGSFEAGGTLTSPTDVLLQEKTGKVYSWTGSYPLGGYVVAPGADPTAVAGYVPRTDVVLRGDLASDNGVLLVGGAASRADIGWSNALDGLQYAMTTNKYALVTASIDVPDTGLSLPSYATVEAQNGAIGFIGATYSANNAIHKNGNASITLSNQDPNAESVTVDAVVYQNPAWPGGSAYPQKSTMRNIGIVGNQSQHNEAGIFVLQGGVLSLDSVDVVNCVNGLWGKDLFLSDIRKLHTLGKIRVDTGTSVTFTDCWARGHVSRVGAFDFTGLKYSVLNGCGSDGAPNTAYSFSNCQGLVLNGCGCEGAETITANSGTALDINDGNTITINGFTCVPVESQGIALITVGSNSKVTITGWDSNFGKNHDMDIYIHGSGSTVEIFSSKFYNDRYPVVSIAVGSTSVVILHKADGNILKYYAPKTFGLASKESFFDKGTWTPVLNFSESTAGIAYSVQTGTWRKNGNQFIANGHITLTSKGSSSGIAFITGLPIGSDGYESAKPNLALGVSGGPIVLALDKGTDEIMLLLDGASGMTNVADTNLTNTTTLRFTMRFTVPDSVF